MSKEMSTVTNKEPLMHISKRDGIETWKSWLIRIIAVLLSLVVCAGVIVALTGLNPIEVYKGIFDGAIGTKRRAWMTIRDTLVLIMYCSWYYPGIKMRFWNIGAEGQVLIGGVTSAAMMIYLGNSFLQWYYSLLCSLAVQQQHDLGRDPGLFQGLLEYQ